jgi:hypothetical protein
MGNILNYIVVINTLIFLVISIFFFRNSIINGDKILKNENLIHTLEQQICSLKQQIKDQVTHNKFQEDSTKTE